MEIKDFIIVFFILYFIFSAIPSIVFLNKKEYKRKNKFIILSFNIIVLSFIIAMILVYNLYNVEKNKEDLNYYNKESMVDYYIENDINPLSKESDVK